MYLISRFVKEDKLVDQVMEGLRKAGFFRTSRATNFSVSQIYNPGQVLLSRRY